MTDRTLCTLLTCHLVDCDRASSTPNNWRDGTADGALTALAEEDPGSVPSTHVGWITTAWNFSPMGSHTVFWLLQELYTHGAHTYK